MAGRGGPCYMPHALLFMSSLPLNLQKAAKEESYRVVASVQCRVLEDEGTLRGRSGAVVVVVVVVQRNYYRCFYDTTIPSSSSSSSSVGVGVGGRGLVTLMAAVVVVAPWAPPRRDECVASPARPASSHGRGGPEALQAAPGGSMSPASLQGPAEAVVQPSRHSKMQDASGGRLRWPHGDDKL
ncbi:hypothetical protein E2C01_028847 [Portunus trituberculatus]|uniref:Uncharacterized protein n=1 Tax=Portunus trituberculatus TaxID=210409 RepID=A0A5B7EPU2_PORTR|nr:hypothetical protein [Portunus trituberculatus]